MTGFIRGNALRMTPNVTMIGTGTTIENEITDPTGTILLNFIPAMIMSMIIMIACAILDELSLLSVIV